MGTLLRKEILEQWRTYRMLIVAAVMLVFGMASPLLARYIPDLLAALPDVPPELADVIPSPTVADAVGQYVENLVQFGVILAILVGMGSVAQEKDKGTAAMLLSKPVSRETFLLAKLLGLAMTFLAGIGLAALGGYYYTGVLFEWLNPAAFAALNALVLLYLLVYASMTLFSSTLARSQVAAGGIAFGLLITFGILGAIPQVGKFMPAALITWGQQISLGTATETAWRPLLVAPALILIFLIGAWAVFRRQEI